MDETRIHPQKTSRLSTFIRANLNQICYSFIPMIWKVKKHHDKKVRARHPWVFSNDILQMPKAHTPGHPVRLEDEFGKFLAHGYGNPNSQISFRALSFNEVENVNQKLLLKKIIHCWKNRIQRGFSNSFRIAYSENDELSGLVIDHYSIQDNGKKGLCLVAQITTAGMQFLISDTYEFFKELHQMALNEKLTTTPWSHTCVVIRNDSQFRKREGLEVELPKVVKTNELFNLENIQILVNSVYDKTPLPFFVDLVNGQKTGFFLDQTRNIEVLIRQLDKMDLTNRSLKVLDICCYLAHWSVQIAHYCKQKNISVEITAVDISEKALEIAQKNISLTGANSVEIIKKDVLDNLDLPDTYDVVICDPPALIKNTKSLPTGQHAYMKLNSNALRLVAPGGLMVTCSCSGLFVREDFLNAIRKSFVRASKNAQIISEGGHAGDHPHLPSFPEGFYLKMFLLHID